MGAEMTVMLFAILKKKMNEFGKVQGKFKSMILSVSDCEWTF